MTLPTTPPSTGSYGLFGKKKRIQELEVEVQGLRAHLSRLAGVDPTVLRQQIEGERRQAADEIAGERAQANVELTQVKGELAGLHRQRVSMQQELHGLHQQVVETREVALLQEVGVYEYHHRLEDAVAYKTRLEELKDAIKSTARSDEAVTSITDWRVNGSAAAGRKMVRDFSKLMLRAYNAEADNLVRTMRPYKLQSAIDKLTKTVETIARLGKTMEIRISERYHWLRIEELRLTADYLVKVDEEKERQRAERERQREEEKARREFEREKARLFKERAHFEAVIARYEASDQMTKAAEFRAKLANVDVAIADVEGREANIRAGYVYVISNIGAFGQNMVKIGMTRRLNPMDRVTELGDASVPFRFDVHALIFSEDAVGLENHLHRSLADKRVNLVNLRREFFRASPTEVRSVLERTAGQHLLEFHETPEAAEWRASHGRVAA